MTWGADDPCDTTPGDDRPECPRSAAERALLESALEFYGAAQGVIDYAGSTRPRVRYDVAGLQAVRDAMAALEERVLVAHDRGVPSDEIASIARLDREMIELIVARRGPASPESI